MAKLHLCLNLIKLQWQTLIIIILAIFNNPQNELYSKVLMSEPNVHSDFSRLARWLTGTSVGLVLGGGGARGAAHIGMLKAILEAGIPIDMVGGVSIGAFMGALWCMEKNITTVTQKAREWSKVLHRQLHPYTSIDKNFISKLPIPPRK